EGAILYSEAGAREPFAHLVERQECWTNLGRLQRQERGDGDLRQLAAARDAFRQARACAEQIRGRFRDPAERSRVQGEALHAYELPTETCVDLWHGDRDPVTLGEALVVSEASRARNLLEMLAEETLQPRHLPEGSDLAERLRNHRRRLRDVRT